MRNKKTSGLPKVKLNNEFEDDPKSKYNSLKGFAKYREPASPFNYQDELYKPQNPKQKLLSKTTDL